jgi:hypothetical protein
MGSIGNRVLVTIESGSTYFLEVRNHHKNLQGDCTLTIDNKFRGIFRLRPDEYIAIRHPYDSQHKFKLIQQTTAQAQGKSTSGYDGIITCTFEPEWEDPTFLQKGVGLRAVDGQDNVKQVAMDERRFGKGNHSPEKVTGKKRSIAQATTVEGGLSKQKYIDVTEGLLYDTTQREMVILPVVVNTTAKEEKH